MKRVITFTIFASDLESIEAKTNMFSDAILRHVINNREHAVVVKDGISFVEFYMDFERFEVVVEVTFLIDKERKETIMRLPHDGRTNRFPDINKVLTMLVGGLNQETLDKLIEYNTGVQWAHV